MRNSTLTRAILTSLLIAAPALAGPEDGWEMLATAVAEPVVDGNRLTFDKTFPDSLTAARNGFEIQGYFVPVEAQAYIQSFLLVEDPADCPFCGGSGYGPVLEVTLAEPMADRPEFSQIAVRGQLEFVDDPETLRMFHLVDARVLPDR